MYKKIDGHISFTYLERNMCIWFFFKKKTNTFVLHILTYSTMYLDISSIIYDLILIIYLVWFEVSLLHRVLILPYRYGVWVLNFLSFLFVSYGVLLVRLITFSLNYLCMIELTSLPLLTTCSVYIEHKSFIILFLFYFLY